MDAETSQKRPLAAATGAEPAQKAGRSPDRSRSGSKLLLANLLSSSSIGSAEIIGMEKILADKKETPRVCDKPASARPTAVASPEPVTKHAIELIAEPASVLYVPVERVPDQFSVVGAKGASGMMGPKAVAHVLTVIPLFGDAGGSGGCKGLPARASDAALGGGASGNAQSPLAPVPTTPAPTAESAPAAPVAALLVERWFADVHLYRFASLLKARHGEADPDQLKLQSIKQLELEMGFCDDAKGIKVIKRQLETLKKKGVDAIFLAGSNVQPEAQLTGAGAGAGGHGGSRGGAAAAPTAAE
ncbi:hypothetical protein T492DRAFT_853931 [Pavlovales sp. CCMP2436]|nr:hypothetical protein T492DRAFT_853931 [Pavlovales sp. CCMP2436]